MLVKILLSLQLHLLVAWVSCYVAPCSCCKLKSCPAAPGWYTHRVHARLLFDSDGVLDQPVCEAPCPGGGAVWRPPSGGQQVAAVAHSLGGDLITTISSRQVKRRSWSWSKWITSITKKEVWCEWGLEDRVRWRKWKHSFRGRERVRFHTCTNYENSHQPNAGIRGELWNSLIHSLSFFSIFLVTVGLNLSLKGPP